MSYDEENVRLSGPGDIVSALPAMFGFVPESSLVLVLLDLRDSGARLDCFLRLDLDVLTESSTEEVAADLTATARRAHSPGGDTLHACLVVVGDGSDHDPESAPVSEPVLDLVTALTAQNWELPMAFWVPTIASGVRWTSYIDPGETGLVEDWTTHPLTMLQAIHGYGTAASRGDLEAALTPTPGPHLQRRQELLDAASTPLAVDAVATVFDAIEAAAEGHAPCEDHHYVSLVVALRDPAARDLAMLVSTQRDNRDTAINLWKSVLANMPAAETTEAAVVLAIIAYAIGDGVVARLSVDKALQAQPGHRMARLINETLTAGLRPDGIPELLAEAAEQTLANLRREFGSERLPVIRRDDTGAFLGVDRVRT